MPSGIKSPLRKHQGAKLHKVPTDALGGNTASSQLHGGQHHSLVLFIILIRREYSLLALLFLWHLVAPAIGSFSLSFPFVFCSTRPWLPYKIYLVNKRASPAAHCAALDIPRASSASSFDRPLENEHSSSS